MEPLYKRNQSKAANVRGVNSHINYLVNYNISPLFRNLSDCAELWTK
jgi:hypothetical protein